MAAYDPRACGARCDICPLRGQAPVAPRRGDQFSGFVFVWDTPSEFKSLEPTHGGGRLVNQALGAAGLRPSEVGHTGIVLCEPAENYAKLVRSIKAGNRKIVSARTRNARKQAAWDKKHSRREQRLQKLQAQQYKRWRTAFARVWTAYEREWQRCAKKRVTLTAQNVRRAARNEAAHDLPEWPAVPRAPELGDFGLAAVPELEELVLEVVTEELQALPHECCRPRLVHDLEDAKVAMVQGVLALTTLTDRIKIKDEIGFPIALNVRDDTETPLPGVVIYSPHMIYHSAKLFMLRGAYAFFVKKAALIMRQGGMRWVDPPPYYTPEKVRQALRWLEAQATERLNAGRPPIDMSLDIETDAEGIAFCTLRCIGVAFMSKVAVLGIHSCADGSYIGDEESLEILKRLLLHRGIRKITHNGTYDLTVLLCKGFKVAPPFGDTLYAHHTLESELPHTLSYVSAVTTVDAPSWKSAEGGGDHGVSETSDKRLWKYNAIDDWRTLQAHPPLMRALEADGLMHVYQQMLQLLPIAVLMRRRGLYVVEENRTAILARLDKESVRCETEMRAALDAACARWPERVPEYDELRKSKKGKVQDFNPNKPNHREAALRLLDIRTPRSEKTDRRKTGADELARVLPSSDPLAAQFVGEKLSKTSDGRGYLGTQAAAKLKSTFFAPPEADGRLRCDWVIHGTANGRWSSRDPNMQNVPKWVRAMYGAPEGWMLVGADYSALELWIVAVYTQAKKLLEALQSADVHRVNTEGLFNLKFVDKVTLAAHKGCPGHKEIVASRVTIVDTGKMPVATWAEDTCPLCVAAATEAVAKAIAVLTNLRVQAKRFVYNANYEGSVQTIWAKLSVEFPGLQLSDVDMMMKAWKTMCPEIGAKARWNENLFHVRQRKEGIGYLESPILGRRRYWSGKEFGLTDAANFPIQSAAADIVNAALIRVHRRVRPLGGYIVAQVHDQIVCEVPEAVAEQTKKVLEEEMPGSYTFRDIPGTWSFPVEAEIGKTLDKA